MDVFFRTNASGSWETIGSNLSVTNGTYTQRNTSMDSLYTKYYWSVNATDIGSGNWTNQTFSFTTVRVYFDYIQTIGYAHCGGYTQARRSISDESLTKSTVHIPCRSVLVLSLLVKL